MLIRPPLSHYRSYILIGDPDNLNALEITIDNDPNSP